VSWEAVCRLADLREGRGFRADTNPPVAVFRAGDELFAIDDTCSHAESSLSDGYVEDCQVECALHSARFDLRTGRATSLPASVDLRTYAVRVDDDTVFVEMPASG
jgi:3-phenylpropionate/trans-cinnamate dioxygenase ferredoxin subunit